jgi:acyl carrier protein
MASVDEESSPLTRLYESKCPPNGTPLTAPITITPIVVGTTETEALLLKQPGVTAAAVVKVDLPFKPESFVAFVVHTRASVAAEEVMTAELQAVMEKYLDSYQVPVFTHALSALPKLPVLGAEQPPVDTQQLCNLAQRLYAERTVVKPRNAVEEQIEAVWREQLGVSSTVSVVASFFDIGGDSLKAGQLINAMRKKLHVQLSVADLFTAPTIEGLAKKVSLMQMIGSPNIGSGTGHTRYNSEKLGGYSGPVNFDSYDYTAPFPSDSWGCLFTQAIPLVVVFPIRRIVIWFILAGIWVVMMKEGWGRFYALLIAMAVSRVTLGIMAPLAGIAAKWIIIGRYKPGRYPLWGAMYLR